VVGAGALKDEVDGAIALIDGNVPGGVAAHSGENRGTVRQSAVVGMIDVELRCRLQSGELAIREIDVVAAVELHPVAIVFGDSDVRIRIARVRVASIERTLRGNVGEHETGRGHDRRSVRILRWRLE